jgi:uncharacterized protein involved in outer membrane biogenesis
LPVAAALAVAVVGAVWIGPRLLDWNDHRAAIEAAASGFLGRNVLINGPIRLSLLPHPSITAEKVDVQDDGDGVRMAARDLTLSLSLGALLTGRVDVTHVTLDRPDIRLPWPLRSGPSAIEPPPWLASLSAEVTRGRFRFGPLRVEDASLTISTGGTQSALQMDGSATIGGRPWAISLALSWPDTDGSAPIKVTMRSASAPTTAFDFSGKMKADGKIAGQMTAHGDDLSTLLPTPALSFDATGTLGADAAGVRLDRLGLVLGTMPADGNLRLMLGAAGKAGPAMASPSLAVHLHTPMLDLTPWLAAFPAASAGTLPIALDLDADAVIYGDSLMRRVGLKIATDGPRIRVDDFHASLPGEAAIGLAGSYDAKALAFTGKMSLDAPSPAVTLHWLVHSKLLPDASAALAGLGNLSVFTDVAATAHRFAMTGLSGRMNDTRLSGNLLLGLGDHPSVAAGLKFDKIDLGNWLPPAWLTNPPRPDVLVHALAGVTADLRLSADQVWLGDEEIDHAVLDAGIAGGALNLRQLAGQDRDLQVVASGALDAKGVVRDGRLVLAAQPATRLMGLLPARLRGNAAFWSAPLAARMTAAGPPESLALNLAGTLGDTSFSAAPVLDLRHGRWQGPVTLRHPNAARLLRQLGFGDATAWLGEGSLSLVANVASSGAGWQVSPLTFSLGLLHGAGRFTHSTSRAPDERGIMGVLAIDTLPWPNPDPDEPIPVELLRGWQASLNVTINQVIDGLSPVASHVVADAGVADGALTIGIKSARVLGGVASGLIRFDGSKPPVLAASLSLVGGRVLHGASGADDPSLPDWLPVAMTAERLDAKLSVTAKGYSLASWLSSLNGVASFTASKGVLSGLDITGLSADRAAGQPPRPLFAGQTSFGAMSGTATVTQGNLRLGAFQLAGDGGTVGGAGQVDLVRGVCNLSLDIKPLPAAPSGAPSKAVTAVLQGPLGNPARWIIHSASGS